MNLIVSKIFLLFCIFMAIAFSGCDSQTAYKIKLEKICDEHFRQIATGLQAYHSAYGMYPPPCLMDAEGRPSHSWRVLILPYTDYGESIKDYKFDERWDGPNNRKITNSKNFQRPSRLYSCPNATLSAGQRFDIENDYGLDLKTNYVMIKYNNLNYDKFLTLMEKQNFKKIKIKQIIESDFYKQKIILMEIKNSNIHWAEPLDIEADVVKFDKIIVNNKTKSNDPSGTIVLFHDGKTKRIK